MNQKKITFFFVAVGVLLVAGSVFLMSASPVKAQCGSQASSCKNCHETQAQDPVNNDGKAWHAQHAFGDFCYLCHAGNSAATEKTAAHTGMVAPLSDIVTNCKSCHPNDYQAQAQVYATTLGVQIGSGAGSATAVPASVTSVPASSATADITTGTTTLNVNDPNVVDYAQRYDEIVLGKTPINWGNIVAIVIIAIIVLGGGYFVARREGWINISFQETKQIQGSYPADVVDMVPEIAKLKPAVRKDLRQIIAKPGTAAEVFALVIKLTKKDEEPSSPIETKPDTKPEE